MNRSEGEPIPGATASPARATLCTLRQWLDAVGWGTPPVGTRRPCGKCGVLVDVQDDTPVTARAQHSDAVAICAECAPEFEVGGPPAVAASVNSQSTRELRLIAAGAIQPVDLSDTHLVEVMVKLRRILDRIDSEFVRRRKALGIDGLFGPAPTAT